MKEDTAATPVNDFTREKKAHGNLDYPIAIYHLDLRSLYMGNVRWHWHEELEIDIVTEGRIQCLVGEESLILKKGDVIFINKNIMHSVQQVEAEPGRFDAIVFHPTIFFGYSQTYLNAKYVTPVVGKAGLRYFTITPEYPRYAEMTALLVELVNATDSVAFGFELIVKSCLDRFWLYMLDEFASFTPKKKEMPSLSEARARDAMLFIESHYQEPVTLDDIATAIHVSKSECCRCFKKALHVTPFEYLMKYRIFMATIKIRQDTDQQMSFSELATTVGFNNVSYFNKVFKDYLGCTPSEYRRNIKNTPSRDAYVLGHSDNML